MALISRAEAARCLGVTGAAVYAAVKAGRLGTVLNTVGDVCVDSTTMREEWSRNTQRRIGVGPRLDPPPQNRSAGTPLRPAAERMAPQPARSERLSRTTESIPDYDESRARTEYLKAELLELDRRQKEGTLVSAAEVEATWTEIITRARTRIMGIPTKAKQRIPDLDVDAISILDSIVRECLEELSGEAPTPDES